MADFQCSLGAQEQTRCEEAADIRVSMRALKFCKMLHVAIPLSSAVLQAYLLETPPSVWAFDLDKGFNGKASGHFKND